MARSKKQNDPFDAGDPSFGGEDFESTGVDEQPPESWDYSGSSSSSSSSSSRRAAKKSAEQEKKRKEQERRTANQRKSAGYSTTQRSSDNNAQQMAERTDDFKKRRIGCTLLLILIFFVLPTLVVIINIAGFGSSSSDYTVSDAEQEEIVGLVQDRLDSLEDDGELREQVALDFDKVLIYYTDYDAEGLGLDPYDFADFLLSELYSLDEEDISSIYLDDDGDYESYVTFHVTDRDHSAESDFGYAVADYLDSEGLSYFSLDELDEEQQAEVQALYDEMLENYEVDSSYLSIDLVQDDGAWEIDESSFEEGVDDTLFDWSVGEDVDYEEWTACGECVNTLYDRLSTLSDDEELHAYLVEEFNDRLESEAHYDAEELGIDADAFADWYLANMWYITYSVSANDYSAEIDLYMMDVDYDDWWDFGDEVEAYLDEQDVSYYSGQALTDAQKEHIQGLYDDFIANYDLEDPDEYTILTFEFSEEDGEWVLDEDTYQSEMEYALDM